MSVSKFYTNETINKAYTAKKLLDLSYLIQQQAAAVYTAKGMVFPVICSSTLLRLAAGGPGSVTDIAQVLEHPHQTIAKHLATLEKLGIVGKQPDPQDRRRTEYHLTAFGQDQAALLHAYNREAAQVFSDLDAEISTDLSAALDTAITSLKGKSFAARFAGAIPS
jgi:DNA-binding MarR family transcriptional regulator